MRCRESRAKKIKKTGKARKIRKWKENFCCLNICFLACTCVWGKIIYQSANPFAHTLAKGKRLGDGNGNGEWQILLWQQFYSELH